MLSCGSRAATLSLTPALDRRADGSCTGTVTRVTHGGGDRHCVFVTYDDDPVLEYSEGIEWHDAGQRAAVRHIREAGTATGGATTATVSARASTPTIGVLQVAALFPRAENDVATAGDWLAGGQVARPRRADRRSKAEKATGWGGPARRRRRPLHTTAGTKPVPTSRSQANLKRALSSSNSVSGTTGGSPAATFSSPVVRPPHRPPPTNRASKHPTIQPLMLSLPSNPASG